MDPPICQTLVGVRRCLQQTIIFTTILLITYHFSVIAKADRVSEKIYSRLQHDHYCPRRLNATQSMGCQSELGGNQGVVWIVDDKTDLDHILRTGPTPPYIAIIKKEYYTRDNLLNFAKNPLRVSGVVFIDSNHDDSRLLSQPFSPEDRCPNRYSGLYVNDSLYGDCKQNFWLPESPISGLLYDNIPFPIFLMNRKESIDEIESCFTNNNIIKGNSLKKQDTYPLCSMQLDSFMMAAIDSETCLNSRSYMDDVFQTSGQRCYTVENQNIFAYYKHTSGPIFPADKSNSGLFNASLVDPQSVVMIIAKLSSLSMFTNLSPGADSTITSIVTLLTVAEALGHHFDDADVKNSGRNIAFALLDSEPYDYTGSSRMVYNMKRNTFPNLGFRSRSNATKEEALRNINLESLDYVINLDQMGCYPDSKATFLHTDPQNKDTSKLDKIISTFKDLASKEGVQLSESDRQLPLPPTSVHKFIEHSKSYAQDKKLLGLVLANYDKTYQNLFYHGVYDDAHNVYHSSKERLVAHITSIANLVAKSSFELAFGVRKDDIKANDTLVGDLLDCYLKSADCPTFTRAMQAGEKLPSNPIPTYRDPTNLSDDINGIVTANLLTYFLGEKVPQLNHSRCHEENDKSLLYNYQYVNDQDQPLKNDKGGVCIKSQVLVIKSTSPSFAVTEDGITVDNSYPAWTVSLNNIRNPPRLFITSSPIHQWCIFVIGIVVTLTSFIAVYQIRGSNFRLQTESQIHAPTAT